MNNQVETEGDELKPVLILSINKDGRLLKTSMKKNEETGNWEKDKVYPVDNIFSLINSKEKKEAFNCFMRMVETNIREINDMISFFQDLYK